MSGDEANFVGKRGDDPWGLDEDPPGQMWENQDEGTRERRTKEAGRTKDEGRRTKDEGTKARNIA